MNNVLSRKNVTKDNFIMVRNNNRVYPVEKPEFCPLKQYSVEEFAELLRLNPIFLAKDFKDYKDPIYARNMCRIYTYVTSRILISLFEIKKFNIADLEKALLKLKQEHLDEYKTLCNDFCIRPEKKSCTTAVIDLSTCSSAPLIRLTAWGYSELFSPNTVDFIEKTADKTYSSEELSDLEKAKWAHLFFTFVIDFNHMAYEENSVNINVKNIENEEGRRVTEKEKQEIASKILKDFMEVESNSLVAPGTLNYTYDMFLSNYENASINLDMVKHLVYTIVGTEYRLQILKFADLLSAEERTEFEQNKIRELRNNSDVRALKEKIFAHDAWATGLNCFLRIPDAKVLKAMISADKKYVAAGLQFGKNVEGYKTPHTVNIYSTGKENKLPGYLYSSTPIRLRISDPNEIRMIHFYLTTNCY